LGSCDPHTQHVLVFDEQNNLVVNEMTWVPALYTAFREILDNSSDEVLGHGYGNRIDITYDEEKLIFSVADNGRGIPFDWDEQHEQHLATMVLTEPRAGRNFGERGEVVGTNGIGASAVSITSEWFNVNIVRDGQTFKQTFREGKNEDSGLTVEEPEFGKAKKNLSGTHVEYHPSKVVYKHRELPEQFVRSRVTEFAVCNPQLKVYYNGEHIKGKPKLEQTLFGDKKPISIEVAEESFTSKFWLVPGFLQDGGEHSHSLVNNIPAFNGGVHMDTFKRMFASGLLAALERESKKRKLQPNRSDIMENVLIYNITKMKAPNFDSQSKTRLINEEVAAYVKKALDDPDFFKNIIKKYGDWIDAMYQRCAERTMKKDAADASKLAKKVLRSKVAGLMDASGTDRTKCILFLAEGLSAISGMASVRDPKIHAGLGLKGKVMNVHGAAIKDVLEDSALQDIMNAMGLIPGQKAKRENLRFGKIYVAHDMDPDGLNIGALLNNFFFTYWPELYDPKQEPVVHIFMTPFIIAEKGKQRKYWYSDNHMDFDPEQYKGWSITRAKGLGTLTEEDWAHSLAEPKLMALRDENGDLKETLDLIFNGSRANDRKAWIGL
jgi:DNA gyrase/topoisomerase IV subunit B